MEASRHSMELTRDKHNLTDLNDLTTQLSVVTQILEEKLQDFAESPSSADSQSYLLIASRRFLSPAEMWVESLSVLDLLICLF